MKSDSVNTKKTRQKPLADKDYRQLAEFRYTLRQFLAFSEKAARASGLTPQQHQALLAIKGLSVLGSVSIGDIAEQLLHSHHSVVELVDRLTTHKLVKRVPDSQDGRRVFVSLTAKAEKLLESLSATHLQELQRMKPQLIALLEVIELNGD